MVVVKWFVYFIVLKVGFQFIYGEPYSLVAAFVASVGMCMIEYIVAVRVALEYARRSIRIEMMAEDFKSVITSTIWFASLGAIVSILFVLAVTYGFSNEFWVRNLKGFRFERVIEKSIGIIALVGALGMINYTVLLWAFYVQKNRYPE